jgi:flagellar protein FliO/FliZ
MKMLLNLMSLSFLIIPYGAQAADAVVASPSGGVFKMLLGLVIVLAVMALITWVLKRMMPGIGGSKQSVVHVVGGVSVGSRERVVVLEVAGRWIVVGVASGQVNGLANLDAGSMQLSENLVGARIDANSPLNTGMSNFTQSLAPTFAQWLKKSTIKFTEPKFSEKKDAT